MLGAGVIDATAVNDALPDENADADRVTRPFVREGVDPGDAVEVTVAEREEAIVLVGVLTGEDENERSPVRDSVRFGDTVGEPDVTEEPLDEEEAQVVRVATGVRVPFTAAEQLARGETVDVLDTWLERVAVTVAEATAVCEKEADSVSVGLGERVARAVPDRTTVGDGDKRPEAEAVVLDDAMSDDVGDALGDGVVESDMQTVCEDVLAGDAEFVRDADGVELGTTVDEVVLDATDTVGSGVEVATDGDADCEATLGDARPDGDAEFDIEPVEERCAVAEMVAESVSVDVPVEDDVPEIVGAHAAALTTI